jgi:EAL domain-containing protein (putative c-di-GMP-specific phosphodiesterase class I)
MHERAVSRLRLERELRAAVERREFVVHYQPIVTLHDRAVIGHEALVRWAHPDHGLLPPDRFIPAAEETGLIVEIGAQVLETVAARLAVDPDAGRISVNVSGVQLRDPEWGPRCRETVTDAGADPARLVIEVTETAVITVLDHVRRSLTTMRAAGVGLHIDDFGSGFSSLSLLRDLPVTGIKLDRSFVHTLGPGGGSANALASGVAFLASGLGLETIAEGIETEQQATMLRGQGWREGQGFLFGRPGPWPS